MEKSCSNKKNISRVLIPVLFCLIPVIYSCNPTKYVPEGETLLNRNHIEVNDQGVKKADLIPYIKQKPNKKIFGARFYLGLYNLSNINKEKWPHSWLRKIGEGPVIFDRYSAGKSREELQSYVASKGFFDSSVTDSSLTSKRKTDVYYNVNLKKPYTVRNIYYDIADTSLRTLFFFDSVNCMIERGKPYDENILQAERSRFERFIKDRGFYGFSGDYIRFRIDSTIDKRQVNIYYEVGEATTTDQYNRVSYVPHSIYRISNIYIYPEYVPKEALEGGEAYLKSLDTVLFEGYYFISPRGKRQLKYDLILQAFYMKPGSIYNVTNTEQTQNHLLSLKSYRLVNIFFDEISPPEDYNGSEKLLNCQVQLTPLSQQSFNVEVEGTNSAGNLGGALNLVYQHKNLFHGAEQFDMKLKGAFEAVTQASTKIQGTQEYGIETSLRFPKFLGPFLKKETFVRNYSPTTTILAAYNYQNMPFYTRTIANATFGYTWSARNYQTHIVNPLQMNIVRLLSIDTAFQRRIENSSYLAYSYKDVMILGANYSLIYNNQKIQKSRDYWFLRFNAEASGNLLSLASSLAGLKKSAGGTYNILGQPFAQYFRTDIDVRYNVIINDVSSAVYRGFIGVGIPYGNSKAIPFEKQYFGGGANGIRAWQVRSLGPGSYSSGETGFVNQTADIKLEANAEYRFKLFWILEGALFVDAGNIWTFNSDPSRPGSQFKFGSFLDDIAVGTGTGFRFDFKFVIGRVDLGMKLRDPALSGTSKWIFLSEPYTRRDFAIVLGIGYPF